MARVPRPPALDVETVMTRMGYVPGGPMAPSPAEYPYPRYRAEYRAYDRRAGNFQAWGWVCVFSYFQRVPDWGLMQIELEVGIPDEAFERFSQDTL